ncbi:MAG: sigma-54-dependent Fis family transcriptional regulator [Gammaproteobacteria bacterium]|nr:MAG: sigma-54-dependent Fis family transcriptional regulator [Gammaproteobacteria bacterium]
MDKILIVDDNPAICEALTLLLELHDYQVVSCHQPKDAISIVQYQNITLVIQDMNFQRDTTSGEEGKTLFYQLRELHLDLPIILITAWTQLAMAVALVKDGAADYLAKPWDDNKLLLTIKNLLELRELTQQNQTLNQKNQLLNRQLNQQLSQQQREQQQALAGFNLCGLIYASNAIQQLLQLCKQVAPADIPVLITGPNGAGKEKIAEIIQTNSTRQQQPFIKVNVGALPVDLMEAELFGAEVGAYTGLTKKRIGRFEAANNGTLFLDEIAELPLSGQVKLLRVLQTGEFEPLGSHQTRQVNVRVISATNGNLAALIKAGKFRQDLFYRLNVIELNLPALNQRNDDILPLAQHFLNCDKSDISPQLLSTLLAHTWSGNVRELENACQRAKLLSAGNVLTAEHFGLTSVPTDKTTTNTQLNMHHEPSKTEIEQALVQQKGVISHVAKQFGLSRQALYRRLHKYEINL